MKPPRPVTRDAPWLPPAVDARCSSARSPRTRTSVPGRARVREPAGGSGVAPSIVPRSRRPCEHASETQAHASSIPTAGRGDDISSGQPGAESARTRGARQSCLQLRRSMPPLAARSRHSMLRHGSTTRPCASKPRIASVTASPSADLCARKTDERRRGHCDARSEQERHDHLPPELETGDDDHRCC
jgi:hypothetical protein